MNSLTRFTLPGISAPLYTIATTPSTNDLATTLLAEGITPLPHLATITADTQTGGHGRLGRTWTSLPQRSLTATTIIRIPTHFGTDALGWVTHACALAIRSALRPYLTPTGHDLTIKWPNDILVDGQRKICGILASLPASPTHLTTPILVGYGINIDMAANERPTPIATSLSLEGNTHAHTNPSGTASAILAATLMGIERRVKSFLAHGASAIDSGLYEEATVASGTIGTEIALAHPTDPAGVVGLRGRAVGLDSRGGLRVVGSDSRIHHVHAGDILTTHSPLPSPKE